MSRVRWECPNGLHAAVLGPRAPRRENVVRYCLPCSAAAGRLVERTAPAVERERAQRAERRALTAARRRERVRGRVAEARVVEVLDYGDDGATVTLDAFDLLRQAWDSAELRHWRGARQMPDLTVRRGTKRSPARDRRDRDGMSGHATYYGDAIVLTVRPETGREWLEAVIVHEAAHAALPKGERHGAAWRGAYLRAVRELYGVTVRNQGATWKLDTSIAVAIRAQGLA